MAYTEIGSYTGDGTDSQEISTTLKPDMVIVLPANSSPAAWRDALCWHGRSQSFHSAFSGELIGDTEGDTFRQIKGNAFRVEGTLNTNAVTYYWIAIHDNQDGDFLTTSYCGNALTSRDIDFTSEQMDFAMVKRDSIQPAVFRSSSSSVSTVATEGSGNNSDIASLDADGITVSDDASVNENNNVSRGEGTAVVGFIDGSTFETQRYAGTGSSKALTFGFNPVAVLVIDETNDAGAEPHVWKTTGMSGGDAKPFNAAITGDSSNNSVEISGSTVTLGSNYSKSGDNYYVLAIADNSAAVESKDLFDLGGAYGCVGGNEDIDITNMPNFSGACSYEWFGRVGTMVSDKGLNLHPLMMFGTADEGVLADSGEYNGGLYLAKVDADGNGWDGAVLRVIHSDYYCIERDEGSINYYNWNTGIVIPLLTDFHLVVTHNGSGHWRVFLDGRMVKEYNLDLDQATYGNRTNGGGGTAKTDTLMGCWTPGFDGFSAGRANMSGICYRIAAWTSQLSDADAVGRYSDVIVDGTTYAGTSPTQEWDFTSGSTPTGITLNNAQIREDARTRKLMPTITPGASGASGQPTLLANGDIDCVATNNNGRVGFVPPYEVEITLRTLIDPVDASRIICRTSSNGGSTGGSTVFDLTGLTSGVLIDRIDTVTLAKGQGIYYVPVLSSSEKITIKDGTYAEWEVEEKSSAGGGGGVSYTQLERGVRGMNRGLCTGGIS